MTRFIIPANLIQTMDSEQTEGIHVDTEEQTINGVSVDEWFAQRDQERIAKFNSTPPVENEKSYATERSHVYKLEVEFILDIVPGAWHQPEDLMNWIAQHNYVKSVRIIPTK